MNFNTIVPSTTRIYNLSLPFRSSYRHLISISHFTRMLHAPVHVILFDLIFVLISDDCPALAQTVSCHLTVRAQGLSHGLPFRNCGTVRHWGRFIISVSFGIPVTLFNDAQNSGIIWEMDSGSVGCRSSKATKKQCVLDE